MAERIEGHGEIAEVVGEARHGRPQVRQQRGGDGRRRRRIRARRGSAVNAATAGPRPARGTRGRDRRRASTLGDHGHAVGARLDHRPRVRAGDAADGDQGTRGARPRRGHAFQPHHGVGVGLGARGEDGADGHVVEHGSRGRRRAAGRRRGWRGRPAPGRASAGADVGRPAGRPARRGRRRRRRCAPCRGGRSRRRARRPRVRGRDHLAGQGHQRAVGEALGAHLEEPGPGPRPARATSAPTARPRERARRRRSG